MITLEFSDRQWIKLCKGHLQEKYPCKGRWVDTLKPLFAELYGWNPDEDKNFIRIRVLDIMRESYDYGGAEERENNRVEPECDCGQPSCPFCGG